MNADIKGSLHYLGKSYQSFEHNGKPMTKIQVKAVLEYGIKQGYKTTDQFKDGEIDSVLDDLTK